MYEGEVCIRHPFFLLVGAAAAVALLHSILPDHWVPLAVIARTQRWRISHVIRVTFLASLGHVLTSLVLGGIIAFIGLQFQHEIDTQQGRIVGVVLILTGSFFLIWGVVGHGPHGHHHADDHDHQHEHPHTSKVTQEPSLVKRLSAIGLSIEKLCRTYLLCGYEASSLTLGLVERIKKLSFEKNSSLQSRLLPSFVYLDVIALFATSFLQGASYSD